jgi:hypothetical protein
VIRRRVAWVGALTVAAVAGLGWMQAAPTAPRFGPRTAGEMRLAVRAGRRYRRRYDRR